MAVALQSPPQQGSKQDQAVSAGAMVFAAGVPTVAAAAAQLSASYAALGITALALRGALAITLALPPDRLGALGPATMTVLRLNAMRRAQYLLSAAERIQASLAEAQAKGASIADALDSAISSERRYYGQHLVAGWNRMTSAARVDTAAGQHGLLLGWRAIFDSRTSPECRAADGKNFRADRMPLIGYPGMVHPHCRCFPGRPFAGARMLPSARLLQAA